MKILYYDCFSGISGDMNVGALIDLGVDKDYLINQIKKLNLDSEYELKITKGIKKGITGTKFDVVLKEHTHHHRHLKDIEDIINKSELDNKIKSLSLDIFLTLAKAEAKVHGTTIDEVHFHEVGAIDSIIDIVGAAICIDYLKPDKIMCSTVQLGGGFVKCEHGLIPVPAPATVEILKDIPVKCGLVKFETTTPTGAAILASNVDEFSDKIEFSIKRIGYGLGTKEFDTPNVLRVFLGEVQDEIIDTQYMIETNIDDMNPEVYNYIEEKLFSKGALDVFITHITMKKGRPGIKLSVLTNKDLKDRIIETIFTESTSIGIREYEVKKTMLKRDFEKIETKYGQVTLKNSYYNNQKVNSKLEYEDIKSIASSQNIPIKRVYDDIYNQIEKK